MGDIVIGIIALAGLVALRGGMNRWTMYRVQRAWEGARADLDARAYDAAEGKLATCVRLLPTWIPARFTLGAVLAAQGKLAEAEAQLKLARDLEPRQPEGHIELGIYYLTAAKQPAAGVAALREAITLKPDVIQRINTDPRLAAFRDTEDFTRLTDAPG